MIAIPLHRSNHSLLPFLLVGLALLVYAIMLASTHAVINHGQAAMDAQNCWNKGGNVIPEVRYDPITFRKMSFCEQNGRWYVSIEAPDGGNVSAFPRSFAKCLRDVLDYAERSGFTSKVFPQ